MSEVIVTHDGKGFTARKRGCPGSVFADTHAEALDRARGLTGTHSPKIVGEKIPAKGKKRRKKRRA